MRVCVVGEGAIGRSHLEALTAVVEADVVRLVGGQADATAEVAAQHGVPQWSTSFDDALGGDVDAVILCTPTPLHVKQASAVLAAGKHCLVEIPVSDSLDGAEAVARAARAAGPVGMVAHTRRFNRGHRWLHQRLSSGDLVLQQLHVETYFLRRTNTNLHGEPRTWTDHLLWHHACHGVDLFHHQTGASPDAAFAVAGPLHPDLGIAMDLAIGLRSTEGAVFSASLSFNDAGTPGSTFRYLCDDGTYVARYDDLWTADGTTVDLTDIGPEPGMVLQDREFLAAACSGRAPLSSVDDVIPTMRTLDRLDQMVSAQPNE